MYDLGFNLEGQNGMAHKSGLSIAYFENMTEFYLSDGGYFDEDYGEVIFAGIGNKLKSIEDIKILLKILFDYE